MNFIIKTIELIDWLNDWIGKIIYPLMFMLCIIVLIEVISRSAFGKPTIWSFEMVQFIFIICTFFAGAHLHQRNEHINVDIIYGRFSKRNKLIIDIITFPFFILFIGSMAYFGYEFAFDSLIKFETSGSAWDPIVFPIKFCVPISATLIFLQGIANIIKNWMDIYKNKSDRTNNIQ